MTIFEQVKQYYIDDVKRTVKIKEEYIDEFADILAKAEIGIKLTKEELDFVKKINKDLP